MDDILFPWRIKARNMPDSEKNQAYDRAPEESIRWNFSGSQGMRVLIADSDKPLSGFLSSELQELGFVVDVVSDGEQAYAKLQDKIRYNLLIAALNLPGIDGLNLIGRVRSFLPRLPIMVLTTRNRIEDKVAAFQIGADDYMTKPFSIVELQARVYALMRRNTGTIPIVSRVGDLTLNREERRVERESRRIDLTPREFALLEVMMRTPGYPVPRATLLAEVWNMSGEPSTNIVDVYMKYVRDKVDGPGDSRLIHTIRGFGYEIREVPAKSVERAEEISLNPRLQLVQCAY
jgi:two-component system, OmpR family, response regulator